VKVIIPGAEELDPKHLADLLEWSKENDKKRVKKPKGKIAPIDAYRELKDRQEYTRKRNEMGGNRRVFGGIDIPKRD